MVTQFIGGKWAKNAAICKTEKDRILSLCGSQRYACQYMQQKIVKNGNIQINTWRDSVINQMLYRQITWLWTCLTMK